MLNDRQLILDALEPHTMYIVQVSQSQSEQIHKAIFFHYAEGKGHVFAKHYKAPMVVDYNTVYYMLIGEELDI